MSLNDKISNKAEELGGKAKEAAGELTDDDSLRDEGKADQIEAGVKGAAEKVKDAVEEGIDKVKRAMHK